MKFTNKKLTKRNVIEFISREKENIGFGVIVVFVLVTIIASFNDNSTVISGIEDHVESTTLIETTTTCQSTVEVDTITTNTTTTSPVITTSTSSTTENTTTDTSSEDAPPITTTTIQIDEPLSITDDVPTIEEETVSETIPETMILESSFEEVTSSEETTIISNTEIVEETTVETTTIPEYIVYKPGTKYVHRSTCHWFDNTCYPITSTDGLEARKCTECNPDIEIVNTYIPPTPTLPITEYERVLLCNLVAREYGSDYVPTAEKAKVVAVVMNRVRDSRFPNDIYSVLTQPYQFSGYVAYSSYTSKVTNDVIAAVDYYFNHTNEFSTSILYFEGDGRWNYFH